MGKLTFKLDDTLKSIVAHAMSNPLGSTYGEPHKKPSIVLVKDDGAYIMSGSSERQLDPASDKGRSVVCYAEGHDPSKPSYSWDKTQAACGGDDFAETLGAQFLADAIARGATKVTVKLTANSIGMEAQ